MLWQRHALPRPDYAVRPVALGRSRRSGTGSAPARGRGRAHFGRVPDLERDVRTGVSLAVPGPALRGLGLRVQRPGRWRRCLPAGQTVGGRLLGPGCLGASRGHDVRLGRFRGVGRGARGRVICSRGTTSRQPSSAGLAPRMAPNAVADREVLCGTQRRRSSPGPPEWRWCSAGSLHPRLDPEGSGHRREAHPA